MESKKRLRGRLLPASHSHGAKLPCWRAKVALGQLKTNKRHTLILNGNFLCLSCPSVTFAFQQGGIVPCKWLAATGLFLCGFFFHTIKN